jgi:hypothetical protein
MFAAGITSTSQWERGGPPDYATGLWGVELRRAEEWSGDATTRGDLGRVVDTSAQAFGADVPGQAYLGFRSYRLHLDAVVSAIPRELHPSRGSVWQWRLAVAGYSSGPGPVVNLVRAVAGELAAVPESDRWQVLARAVVDAARAGRQELGGVRLAGRWRAAFLLLRCERRFRAGRALAAEVAPEQLQWYAGQLASDTIAALERVQLGRAVIPPATPPGTVPADDGAGELREGLRWVRGPAGALGVVLGGTADAALVTSAAVACGPMYDQAGAEYGLRDAARRVQHDSRNAARGSTVAVSSEGVAVLRPGWAPAGGGVAVQGYPTLVQLGQAVPVRAAPAMRRVALAVMGDGREVALVGGVATMRDFAAALARGGARGAVYLDGGRAAHLATREGAVFRHGSERPAAWVVLGRLV